MKRILEKKFRIKYANSFTAKTEINPLVDHIFNYILRYLIVKLYIENINLFLNIFVKI